MTKTIVYLLSTLAVQVRTHLFATQTYYSDVCVTFCLVHKKHHIDLVYIATNIVLQGCK